MSQVQNHLSDQPRAPKMPSPTSMPVDTIEAWLDIFPSKRVENKDNHGIIRSVAQRGHLLNDNLTPSERKVAVKKAQKEHKQALANLKKQNTVDTTAIKKQQAIWKAEERAAERVKAEKIAAKKKTAANKRAAIKRAAKKASSKAHIRTGPSKKALEAIARRAPMIEILKSGGIITAIDWRGDTFADHQQQSYDLTQISDKEQLDIIRINRLQTRTTGFIVDKFERCEIKKPISCLLDSPDKDKLLELLCSSKVITVEQITDSPAAGSRTMTKLARKYGFDIYALAKSNKLIGWVLMDK